MLRLLAFSRAKQLYTMERRREIIKRLGGDLRFGKEEEVVNFKSTPQGFLVCLANLWGSSEIYTNRSGQRRALDGTKESRRKMVSVV